MEASGSLEGKREASRGEVPSEGGILLKRINKVEIKKKGGKYRCLTTREKKKERLLRKKEIEEKSLDRWQRKETYIRKNWEL